MSSKGEASSPRLKLVIRRLPPTLPEEVFWNSVAPWVTDTSCSWKRFIKGRPSEGPYDHALHSRAYCLMSDVDSLVKFHRAFDGHVFRSKTGAEYQAVIEFAPVQKTPLKTKSKVDARQGTIDEGETPLNFTDPDPDFKSYLDSLQTPQPKAIIEPSLPVSQPTTTPLLEFLRNQGTRGSKKKAKTESSSTDIARNAAVAAVSASAARRNPKDQGGAMVAGKGRAVVVAPTGSEAPAKKSRNKKGKAQAPAGLTAPPPIITAKNFPALAAGPSTTPKLLTRPATAPSQPPKTAAQVLETIPRPTPPSTRGRGRGRGMVTLGGDRRPVDEAEGRTDSVPTPGAANRGGGRGRGRGGGRDKGTREVVTGILSRESDSPSSRGRRGRGGGTAPDPRSARIDA